MAVSQGLGSEKEVHRRQGYTVRDRMATARPCMCQALSKCALFLDLTVTKKKVLLLLSFHRGVNWDTELTCWRLQS